jgi:hypothetical protein
LTLKLSFELRGWDIEKFESIDPTDGFGSDTRVYISNNQVVQIEPDYNIQTFNTWLTKADSSLMEYSRLGHLMKVTSQPLKIHG